jgi:hypothetical protein
VYVKDCNIPVNSRTTGDYSGRQLSFFFQPAVAQPAVAKPAVATPSVAKYKAPVANCKMAKKAAGWKGYVLEAAPAKNVFKDVVVLGTRRVRKPSPYNIQNNFE